MVLANPQLLTTHYMEEVQFLCARSGRGKPGRIVTIDRGKPLELITLEKFSSCYGKAIAPSAMTRSP